MKPPKRVVHLAVASATAAGLGFAVVFTTLQGTIEPIHGWPLAAPSYGLAIALTVILVRLVIRTAPTRRNGSGIDYPSDGQT